MVSLQRGHSHQTYPLHLLKEGLQSLYVNFQQSIPLKELIFHWLNEDLCQH